ncbi:D-alanyl-D-alanine carboxypeptidase [Sinorhizobium fredii]
MRNLQVALAAIVAFVAATASAFAGSASFVIDARSGRVLSAENADELNYPASLTKMMTLYLTFEALHRGEINWETPVPMSKEAARKPPTKLGLKPGGAITVEEAVYGMIVHSANDAAAAMAEKLGGSEAAFAQMMTARARRLGMTRTVFVNASGLPASQQVTTARDMARLGMALLRDFPREYRLFSAQSFNFRGRVMRGHNRLMYRYDGMDGIKTGYTNASGFNLVSAVRDGNRRIIGVVLGGRTAKSATTKWPPCSTNIWDARPRRMVARRSPQPNSWTRSRSQPCPAFRSMPNPIVREKTRKQL